MVMVEANNNAATDPQATVHSAEAPGARLSQAREQAGLSVAEVARRLNLVSSQVTALEQGNYERFAGPLFVKGHLRSYARLLKLDVDAVLGAYGARLPLDTAEVRAQRPAPRRPPSLESNKQRRYWGVAAAALVVLALWGWQQARERSERELLSLTAETPVSDATLNGGIDVIMSGSSDAALLDSVQLLPTQVATAPAQPAPAPVEGADAAAATPAEPAAPAGDTDRLSLRFSADCWVEIKDRDNKLLVAVLKHGDDELKIEGRGPFKVLLGYAPGVEMAYNGTPVKVDVPDRSRSARLIVGNS